MNLDLISVIVCTYNQQDTIARTLDSILMQQSRLPIEIVIGEDCSTDNTLAVCRQYEQKHPDKVRILANKPNKGFVRNYFDCLRACRGKYVADCSGDDFWISETKLLQSAQVLDEHPNVGIVHTDWLRYNPQTGQMQTPEGHTPPPPKAAPQVTIQRSKDILAQTLMPGVRPTIQLCTSLYRHDWILQAMNDYPQFFNPDTYRCEDVQIAFFLAQMGDVAYIDTPTLAYACGGTTISNPASEEKQFHFWANVTQLAFDLARTFHLADTRLDSFFQARIHKLLMHAFRSGQPSLRAEAYSIQQSMHVADNRQILLAKALMHPCLWTPMRSLRNLIKHRR